MVNAYDCVESIWMNHPSHLSSSRETNCEELLADDESHEPRLVVPDEREVVVLVEDERRHDWNASPYSVPKKRSRTHQRQRPVERDRRSNESRRPDLQTRTSSGCTLLRTLACLAGRTIAVALLSARGMKPVSATSFSTVCW